MPMECSTKSQGAAENFHRAAEEVFQILHTRGVGRYDLRVEFGGEFVDLAEPEGYGRIGEYELSAFFCAAFRYFPGDGFVV
jgi:hypothetical protein